MRLQAGFLSRQQVETIHRNALRVLEEVGVKVEHEQLRRILQTVGGAPDAAAAEVVRFPAATVEKHLADAPRTPLPEGPARVTAHLGVYESRYLEPETGQLVRFDEQRLARYVGLARRVGCVEHFGMLLLPFRPPDIPAPLLPLAERLYGWKHGLQPSGSVVSTDLCEPLLDMFACHAAATGRTVQDVFRAGGYLVSPLRLARLECEQLLFFHARGLRMFVGNLPCQGGTAPVTFAGALTLTLAEQIFILLLGRALWGDEPLHLGGTPATMDMRNGLSCYGRPEMQRFNVALADVARFYGCSCSGHTGLTDAKAPSCEAGAQKAAGALITALACGTASVSAGLLARDEICSPVQLVLDGDIVRSLQSLLARPEVTDELCALDDICSVGPGGNFLASDLTAKLFHVELFRPATWSFESASGWAISGARNDVDRARERALELQRDFEPEPHITEQEEKDLRGIICRARKTLEG